MLRKKLAVLLATASIAVMMLVAMPQWLCLLTGAGFTLRPRLMSAHHTDALCEGRYAYLSREVL